MADIVLPGEGHRFPMVEPYRWTVRGVNPELVRQMRILAIRRDCNVSVLVDAALENFLLAERDNA
jgi:hypothetical protein